MTYEDLVDFIENRMGMSHIYQPLLIKTLVESDGSVTLRYLANVFLCIWYFLQAHSPADRRPRKCISKKSIPASAFLICRQKRPNGRFSLL